MSPLGKETTMKILAAALFAATLFSSTTGAVASCVSSEILPPLSRDLTSNRFDNLSRGTLQLVAFYDGVGTATASVQLRATANPSDVVWASLEAAPFSDEIATAEFDTTGYEVTGVYSVDGVVPNGVIDGLGFGLFWKNDAGDYFTFRSRSADLASGAAFVGAWPLGLSDQLISDLTPQLSSSFAREQVRASIYGAKLLDNGCYHMPKAATELGL